MINGQVECNAHPSQTSRLLICRRFAVARYNNFYGYGSGSTLYTDISCTGNETSLFSCNNSRGRNTCYQHHDVGVDCEPCKYPIVIFTAQISELLLEINEYFSKPNP